jgi:hypothetical protein
MENISELPLINAPLDPPPNAGVRFRDNAGFIYSIIEAKPHTNKDGTPSWLITLEGQCAECGCLFSFKQGPKRGNFARRCDTHAKGKGREKVYPYGRAPVVSEGQRPRQETDILRAHANRFDEWCEAEAGKDPTMAKAYRSASNLFAEWSGTQLPDEDDASDLLS